MNQNVARCTGCFDDATEVVRATSIRKGAALRLFTELNLSGCFPAMCLTREGHFNVCHQPKGFGMPGSARRVGGPQDSV